MDTPAVDSAVASDDATGLQPPGATVEGGLTSEYGQIPVVSEPRSGASPASAPPQLTTATSRPLAIASTPTAVKVVYFVRHAESAYNAYKLNPVNWLTLRALRDPMLFDPPLSPLGLSQLAHLTHTANKWRLTERAQLLVVSPLKRAIDTALAVMEQPLPTATQQQSEAAQTGSAAATSTPPYPLPCTCRRCAVRWWIRVLTSARPRPLCRPPTLLSLSLISRSTGGITQTRRSRALSATSRRREWRSE